MENNVLQEVQVTNEVPTQEPTAPKPVLAPYTSPTVERLEQELAQAMTALEGSRASSLDELMQAAKTASDLKARLEQAKAFGPLEDARAILAGAIKGARKCGIKGYLDINAPFHPELSLELAGVMPYLEATLGYPVKGIRVSPDDQTITYHGSEMVTVKVKATRAPGASRRGGKQPIHVNGVHYASATEAVRKLVGDAEANLSRNRQARKEQILAKDKNASFADCTCTS